MPLVGEKPPPSLGEPSPPGVFFSTEGGLFHLNWGVLGGFITPSGGVAGGGGSALSGGFFLPVWGGFVCLFGGFFSPFCQFILKAPWLYRKCYRTGATPSTHPSRKICSLCVLCYNSGWVWLYPPVLWAGGLSPYRGGGGGYGPSLCEPEITVPAPFPFEICRCER